MYHVKLPFLCFIICSNIYHNGRQHHGSDN